MDHSPVNGAGGYDDHIPGAERALSPGEEHVHPTLDKQIDLVIGMAVIADALKMGIAVIEQLKILRQHILAAVEFRAELRFNVRSSLYSYLFFIIPQL